MHLFRISLKMWIMGSHIGWLEEIRANVAWGNFSHGLAHHTSGIKKKTKQKERER